MLYKIFLLGVIIFSSISIGNIIVGEKEQRLKALSELENCIKAMRNGMVYQGMTFYEALKHTGRAGLNGFFGNCAEILRQHPEWEARQVYDQALKEPGEKMGYLQEPEKEALRDLLMRLSTALVVEQISDAAAIFFRQLHMIHGELLEAQRTKSRAIKTVCLLCGLATAVILV